eukprot:TRINITY_DN6329_c0_g1_i1.p1 TRINITY_DN6329_c0_g1~~TRINITY_DN6329_c0_g1_i1.p1  ORF type:complete len:310 (-),score=64.02 TRINITY_DN6329_c0_g1_i1:892-1821(-)
MDEDAPDVFTVSVGNLPPHCDAIIKIIYVTELTLDGDEIAFIVPATLAPGQDKIVLAQNTQSITRTVGSSSVASSGSGGVSVLVSLSMPYKIVSLRSGSDHPIRIKRTETRATVEMEKTPQLFKNFVLLIGIEECRAPRMWVEVNEQGHHASMLAFLPQFQLQDKVNNEHIFVVDRSSSMKGASLNDVKRVLLLLLSNMPRTEAQDDRGEPDLVFNIVSYGDTSSRLFVKSIVPNEANLTLAWHHVLGLQADMGGTDLHSTMKSTFLALPQTTEKQVNLFVSYNHCIFIFIYFILLYCIVFYSFLISIL